MSRARFLRSELRTMFRRPRNLALLVVLGLVPVLICVAIRSSDRHVHGSVLGGVSGNGLFAVLAAFYVAGSLLLPLAIAVVAGDTVAGEAAAGTLRYLLAVPVGRTRLLVVKAAAVVAWTAACVLVLSLAGLAAGLITFPTGDVTLLSGHTVSFADGVGRVALAAGYVAATILTVGAVGLFFSTVTEVPLAAMTATLTLTVGSEVVDAVPQFGAVHAWLPTHRWLAWVDLLREPVDTAGLVDGLLVSLGWVALFASLAWARFGGKDVTS